MLGFLGSFGLSQDLTQAQNFVNIAFHSLSETQAGIASCQAAGKPVILSIGGAASNYGFTRCVWRPAEGPSKFTLTAFVSSSVASVNRVAYCMYTMKYKHILSLLNAQALLVLLGFKTVD